MVKVLAAMQHDGGLVHVLTHDGSRYALQFLDPDSEREVTEREAESWYVMATAAGQTCAPWPRRGKVA